MKFSSDPINTLENLISKNKTKSISIYLMVVLALLLFIMLLPVIKIDISSQSRGIIRSKTDNVPVTTIVSGRIIWLSLRNNVVVNKGDTLIKMAKDGLITDKATQGDLSNTLIELQEDVTAILNGKTANLKTTAAIEDFYKYKAQKSELQSKVSQA